MWKLLAVVATNWPTFSKYIGGLRASKRKFLRPPTLSWVRMTEWVWLSKINCSWYVWFNCIEWTLFVRCKVNKFTLVSRALCCMRKEVNVFTLNSSSRALEMVCTKRFKEFTNDNKSDLSTTKETFFFGFKNCNKQ